MVPEDPLLADWQSSETAVKKPWSLYQSTPKSTTRNKTFLIESNEEPPVCPCCGGKLFLRDHRRRHGKTYQGEVVTFLIPRLKCSRCKRLHNALPDCLVPHKHSVSEVIENVIDEVSTSEDETTEDYPCERTMERWKKWFSQNKIHMDGFLKSALSRLSGDGTNPLYTGESLLQRCRDRGTGWIGAIEKVIYNSGGAFLLENAPWEHAPDLSG